MQITFLLPHSVDSVFITGHIFLMRATHMSKHGAIDFVLGILNEFIIIKFSIKFFYTY